MMKSLKSLHVVVFKGKRPGARLSRVLLLSLCLGICSGALVWGITFAQSSIQFDTSGHSVGAPGPGQTMSALVYADVDGDGDADLVSGDGLGHIIVWRNDSSPFDSGWESFTVGSGASAVSSMAAGDLDGDGDVDIVVGYGDNTVAVWENNGTLAGWSSGVIGTDAVRVNALQVGDVDGNGSLDVVSGGGNSSMAVLPTSDNRITIWLNGPLGTAWTSIDVGEAYYAVRSIGLGDLDMDGDLDIVFGTNHAPPEGTVENPVPREEWPDVYQIRAFRNDGVSSWHEIDVGRDPEFETLSYNYHGYWGASISSVSLADLDNDGDLDIVSTDHMEGDFQVMGWENDGSPFSGPDTLWRGSAIAVGPYHNWLYSSVFASATGDLDNDGDVDVATANAYAATGQAEVIVWENTGIAFHEVVSQTHWVRHDIGEFEASVNAVVVRVTDLDLDGDLDLASAGNTDSLPHAIMVWRNNLGDRDGDSIPDDVDNCPDVYNPDQADSDGDGVGDVCDGPPVPTCVTLQRGTLGEVADGYIWEAYPTLGSFTDARLRTGLYTHPRYGAGENRALLHFELDSVPADAFVQSATLGMNQITSGSGETVDVYRITQAWTEGEPTWDTFASSYDDSTSWGSFFAQGDVVSVDITGLVSAWVAGSQSNYGLMLISSPAQALDEYYSSDYSNSGMRPWLEVCYFEDELPDADGDGVEDPVDNCPATPNADQVDSDSDGFGDVCDTCPFDPDNDADGDGICGDVDSCPLDPENDADGDGVCGDVDNCPDVYNPGQEDSDGDGVGNACEPDADGDGVVDDDDNCPATPNADQVDSDGDGAGDVCDACPLDPEDDVDGDGVCGDVDNCPLVHNPGQEDSDGDGTGDACEGIVDSDGDGVADDVDNCPATPNADQLDSDGDGVGDACDVCANDPDDDADGDGVCGDVDNCPGIYNPGQEDSDGDGVGDACEGPVEPTCVTVQRDVFGEVADGYIVSGRPTLGSFTGSSFSTGLSSSGEARALLQFGLDSLPAEALVQSATLGLEQRSPGTGETVDVYRITQAWTEGEPTWNTYASSYDDTVSWASFVSVGGSLTVDVTDLTSAWVAGSQPNYGLMLISSDPQAEDRYLSSDYSTSGMRPWLEVCYIEGELPDADGDGVPDSLDNCPATPNADQLDSDEDGSGDVCDPCPLDPDNDADGDGVCGDVDPCPLDPDNDADADGVCGDVDNCPLIYNPGQEDADGDGVGNACEPDADGDGVVDDDDNCPATPNTDQLDSDGDGAGDVCDACPLDPEDDVDGDGVCGDVDNCPLVHNPGQEDSDGDGTGDACEGIVDSDGDGVADDVDNCPATPNAAQLDSDGDGVGDACDVCANDPEDDADGDGVCGDVDNCPASPNADQLDSDGDGAGDACDACANDPEDDADGDGVCGDVDNCPDIYNPGQEDSDGDGVGDACEGPVEPTCVTVQRDVFGEVADGYIVSGRPTQGSFTGSSFSTGLSSSGEARALLRFGLDSLPVDALVQSATLGLEQRSPGTGETVDVYRLTQAWTEGEPTWNTYASSYDDTLSWASFVSVGGSLTVDVTDLTSDWVAGSQPNYGLMLISSDPQAEDRYLSSDYGNIGMRPWLEVCYIEP